MANHIFRFTFPDGYRHLNPLTQKSGDLAADLRAVGALPGVKKISETMRDGTRRIALRATSDEAAVLARVSWPLDAEDFLEIA